jgi:hypothetical protein
MKTLGNFKSLIESKFPWLMDEMKGFADGSGVSFEHVLAINLRVELLHLNRRHSKDCVLIEDSNEADEIEKELECSDFYLSNQREHAMLHNEDADSAIYETCYLVTYKTKSQDYKYLKKIKQKCLIINIYLINDT